MSASESPPTPVFLKAMGVISSAGDDAASRRRTFSSPEPSGVDKKTTVGAG